MYSQTLFKAEYADLSVNFRAAYIDILRVLLCFPEVPIYGIHLRNVRKGIIYEGIPGTKRSAHRMLVGSPVNYRA